MSWFGRQLAKYLTGDIAIGGSLSVAGAITGAPAAADWTPTLSAGGSMTVASPVITTARYMQIGKLVWVDLVAAMTLGGTADDEIYSTLPVAAANQTMPIAGFVIDSGTIVLARVQVASGDKIIFVRGDGADFTLTTNQRIRACGCYEAA